MRGFYTIILLTLSNVFMALAWYGHLRFASTPRFSKIGLFGIMGMASSEIARIVELTEAEVEKI